MRWILACALLVTAALLATSWEPPRRADRIPLELQESQRPRQPPRPEGAGGGEPTAAGTARAAPPADPFAVAPDHRAVQLLGADGRPVAGFGVAFHWNRKRTTNWTDEHGLARIDPEGAPARATVGGRSVELVEPLTVVQLANLVPVTIVLVDAQSGARLDTPCRATPTHVLADESAFLAVKLDAPDGYVVFERNYSGKLAASARAALLLVPARPEARLVVRVRTADGAPAAGARIHSAEMAGRPPVFRDGPAPAEQTEVEGEVRARGRVFSVEAAPAGADGRLHVRGIPFLQGERIGLVAVRDSRHAWVEARLPARNTGCTVDVTLPAGPNHLAPAADVIFGFGGGAGGSFRGRGGSGQAEILVYRRDGTPAAGVRVVVPPCNRSGRTDQNGLVRFTGLPGGTQRVLVLEPGFTRAEATFTPTPGDLTRLRLDEPPGWTVRVLVLDEVGDPVPFARLHVVQMHSVVYMDLADGVHDLVRYTDERGEAELARLSDGPVEITATFGTRRAKAKVERGAGLAILRLGAES